MKHFFISLLMLFAISSVAKAQLFETPQKAMVNSPSIVTKTKKAVLPQKAEKEVVVQEEIRPVIERVELPPTEMTIEQKAEIDMVAKKDIHSKVKKQPVRERKDVIDSLVVGENILARRKALLEGKTEEDAAKVAEQIKDPEINPAVDTEMEKFLYQKAGLNNE